VNARGDAKSLFKALEATIGLHTTKSTTVYYEIDGEIVEERDA
jgi:hypothetical protein